MFKFNLLLGVNFIYGGIRELTMAIGHISEETIVGIANATISVAVLLILVYYLKFHTRLYELSRRFLFAGLFLGIHQLTFFLNNPLVYELTKTMFFLTLFYSLMFIVRNSEGLELKLLEQEKFNRELKARLDEIKKEVT